jgi:hypothetical protein
MATLCLTQRIGFGMSVYFYVFSNQKECAETSNKAMMKQGLPGNAILDQKPPMTLSLIKFEVNQPDSKAYASSWLDSFNRVLYRTKPVPNEQ